MFDIGFPELMLISIIALVVIGPARLPETIGSIMLWIGKIKNSFSSIKQELERELGADEIRQKLHNDSVMKALAKTRSQVDEVIEAAESAIKPDDLIDPPAIKNTQPQEPVRDEPSS